MGSALYSEAHLQRLDVQVGLGQQLLELGVLAFDLAQPRDLAGLHAAERGPPLVGGRIAEAAQTAWILDQHFVPGLLEKTDDLLFDESALLHVCSSFENGFS